jgi:hypothetical protein
MRSKAVKRSLFQEKDSATSKGKEISNEAMTETLLQQHEQHQKRQKSKLHAR